MARISSDPIANYRGRIGKISYYIRECENMARKSSSTGKISDSPAAVAQRTKFGRLIKLSRELAPAITLGFPQRKRGQSPANAFMSLNKEICTLEDDTLTVDYEQLQCAQGSLTEPDITATYNTSTSKITFENTAMEDLAYCNADDKTYGVLVNPRGRMPGDSSRRTRRKRLDKRHSSCKMGKRTRNSVRFRHEREQEDGFAICLYHTDRRGLTRRQGGPPCRLYKYHYQIFKVLYHESQRFYQRTISRKTQ